MLVLTLCEGFVSRVCPRLSDLSRVKSEVSPPRQVPNPVTQLISCPPSPLPPSLPAFSTTAPFQFAKLPQGCRWVRLRVCFSKNTLPFIFILSVEVWDSAAERTRWKARCLESLCSAPCLQGWPRGAVSGGRPSCCRHTWECWRQDLGHVPALWLWFCLELGSF